MRGGGAHVDVDGRYFRTHRTPPCQKCVFSKVCVRQAVCLAIYATHLFDHKISCASTSRCRSVCVGAAPSATARTRPRVKSAGVRVQQRVCSANRVQQIKQNTCSITRCPSLLQVDVGQSASARHRLPLSEHLPESTLRQRFPKYSRNAFPRRVARGARAAMVTSCNNLHPRQCPHSARTVPSQCPHSALTVPSQCPHEKT